MFDFKPTELTWSFSSQDRFDSCRRRYYYHRFWGYHPKSFDLCVMRNLTSLAMLKGSVVHDVVAEALRGRQAGTIVNATAAKEMFQEKLKVHFNDSLLRRWEKDKRGSRKLGEVTNLFEHYYSTISTEESKARIKAVGQDGLACLDSLWSSDLWQEISEVDPTGYTSTDEGFPSFNLDGIKVYMKVDFAYTNGRPTIIDWKSGKPQEKDRRQVQLYTLFAQDAWGWDPLDIDLKLVYLPEVRMEVIKPDENLIEELKDSIRNGYTGMLALEPGTDRPDIRNFPPANRGCKYCNFKGACDAVNGTDTADAPGDEEDWL